MNFFYRPSNKYHARKTVVNGIKFDSQHEAERYLVLQDMQSRGLITGLELQKKFELIPNQYIEKKLVERKISYVADFVYMDKNGMHVEDAKGLKTEVYKIKKKLMLHVWGIQIEEV